MEQQQIFKIEEKRFINKQSRKKKIPVYQEKINVLFQYSFQDYLKLALAKIIPYAKVVIDPREKLIHGLKQDCQKFKRLCEEELQKWSYKNLMFKKQIDIDEIDYLLNRQYQAKFFRQGYIKRAINTLHQYSGLEERCQEFEERVANKKIIIIRVNCEYVEECLKKIYTIIAGKQRSGQNSMEYDMMKNKSQQLQNETEETVVSYQDSINYYALMHEKDKKLHKISNIDSSLTSSLSTSSLSSSYCQLTLTQIDPSIIQDSLRTENSQLQPSLANIQP